MPTLCLALLGTPQLTHTQLGQIGLPNRKALALLSYLVVGAPAPQSRETLLALLWPELNDAEARNNLRVTWAWLRQRLGDSTGSEPTLHSTRLDLGFHPQADLWCDLHEFNSLMRRCDQHQHRSRGQCSDCQERMVKAVALYQGDFLSGLTLDGCPEFEAWLCVQREHCHMQMSRMLEELAQFHETQGQLSQAEAYTRQQLALDALQESTHRRLMRLLLGQGRRAAALAQYALCRDMLAVELGIEPELETTALYEQLKTELPPSAASTPRPTLAQAMPDYVTPFIGREAELAALGARLQAGKERLITIIGPGGIGKTRLAQQIATTTQACFHDGIYLVPLVQIATVESIPAAIAKVLGLAFTTGQNSPLEQVIEMLAARHILLVLDNFEHLSEGADLLLHLLKGAPRLILLITSRECLNLQVEDMFELDGLPTPMSSHDETAEQFAAVQLFIDRAQRMDKRFLRPAAYLPQIVQICQLVEGFPLAIELAATWTRDLSCEEIVTELKHGSAQLETTIRDIAPHHHSLRMVFDGSWRLLTAAEQVALLRLAVFQGSVSRDAAQSVAGVHASLLHSLRNKSLLHPAGARRYAMHAIIQQSAGELLEQDPVLATQLRRGHSRYFLAILSTQAVALDSRTVRTASDGIQLDWENIRQAWQSAAEAEAYDLLEAALDGLLRFCSLRGLFAEAYTALEQALCCHREPLSAGYCRLLIAQAAMASQQGLEQSALLIRQARTLAERLNAPDLLIATLLIQADGAIHYADYPAACGYTERALALAEQYQLELQIGRCLHSLALIDYLRGNFDQASTRFEQVLAIHQRSGQLEQPGREAVGRLGIIASEQGRHDIALQYLQEYLASCERCEDRRNIVHAHHHLAFVWIKLGEYAHVVTIMDQNIARARALVDLELTSLGLHLRSWAQRMLGQLDQAFSSANEAVAIARHANHRLALAYALQQLAEVSMERASTAEGWAEASACFQNAASSFRSIDKDAMAYETEIGLAELYRRQGALTAALELLQPIIPHLPVSSADGWDAPLRAYVVAIQVLGALENPTAEVLLSQALSLLSNLAARIEDPALRQGFLQLPAHRSILAFSEAQLV